MFRRLNWASGLSLVSLLFILLALASPLLAQGPITPHHTDPVWQAAYWNNTTLSGNPALEREENNLYHDWGVGSPHTAIQADNFSARWRKYIDVTPGTYEFTVTSDDGIRLWIDNTLIIDRWYDHAAQTFTAKQYLGSGHHLIVVEYYEKGGLAVAKLSWKLESDPGTIYYWRGEYYNNMTLGGTPALVRDDTNVNFNWGTGSPAPGIVSADHFSVRWTRTVNLPSGMYHFSLTTDDGARLWVNGHKLVDAWYDQAPRTYTGDLYLPGGDITIELQYYENSGGAVAQLSWTTHGGPTPTPTPSPGGTVIVDDTDPGFVKGGEWTGWRTEPEGYNGHLTWTFNNDQVRYNYNWGRWYPSLQARRYEVFVYIPERYTTSAQARYWISHANGTTLRIVDQSTQGDRWVSLGTYWFRGSSSDYVSLADVTYEPYRTRLIAFDAVKWEPR